MNVSIGVQAKRVRSGMSAGILLLLAAALLGSCIPEREAHDETTERETWDSRTWRERLRAHAGSVDPLLPVLAAVEQTENPIAYRDTLRATYAALQAAEGSIPPVPWGANLPHAELYSRYREAIRELRYASELMLEGLNHSREGSLEEGRYFITIGLRHFREVRPTIEQEPPPP